MNVDPDYLDSVVGKLGSALEDTKAVLREHSIHGDKCSPIRCPVANYVMNRLGTPDWVGVLVGAQDITVQYYKSYPPQEIVVALPNGARSFVAAFDGGLADEFLSPPRSTPLPFTITRKEKT